jgi:DNA-binding NarL/FixJ family response regulator
MILAFINYFSAVYFLPKTDFFALHRVQGNFAGDETVDSILIQNSAQKPDGASPPLKSERISNLGNAPQVAKHSIVILDDRALDRQCLAQCMAACKADLQILPFGSIDEWERRRDDYPPLSAILMNIGGKRVEDQAVSDQIQSLASKFTTTPVIILADSEDFTQIVSALDLGAKGYIPTSVDIGVCMEVISLSVAGGVFVPASVLFSMRHLLKPNNPTVRPLIGVFTDRQAEVVEALRRGKANKIIAHELNLRESTVKVHVRNIMKKVKATNRTEVVFKINDLFPDTISSQRMNRTPF